MKTLVKVLLGVGLVLIVNGYAQAYDVLAFPGAQEVAVSTLVANNPDWLTQDGPVAPTVPAWRVTYKAVRPAIYLALAFAALVVALRRTTRHD